MEAPRNTVPREYGPCERSKSWPTSLPAFETFSSWRRVVGAFTAATAKALSIPSWPRRLSFLLSFSPSLFVRFFSSASGSSSFQHRQNGALVFLNAQRLILLDRTRPRCVKRDVVARNYFMPRSSSLFVVIRMIASLACA